MQYLYQRSQMGTSATCQGSKGADIGETCSLKQTSRLKLQTDIRAYTYYTDFSSQEDPLMDNVALFGGAHIHTAL